MSLHKHFYLITGCAEIFSTAKFHRYIILNWASPFFLSGIAEEVFDSFIQLKWKGGRPLFHVIQDSEEEQAIRITDDDKYVDIAVLGRSRSMIVLAKQAPFDITSKLKRLPKNKLSQKFN